MQLPYQNLKSDESNKKFIRVSAKDLRRGATSKADILSVWTVARVIDTTESCD